MRRKGRRFNRLLAVGCAVGLMLTAWVPLAVASANVLLMPNRQALVNQSLVVWGNTKHANGSAFTLDFGDGQQVAGNVVDQSYIAANHTYTTTGIKTVTLTVNGESETTEVEVLNPVAGSETERGIKINMAIEDGLRYVYQSQNGRAARFNTNKTSWRANGSDDRSLAFSALVLLALQNHGHGINGNPLKDIYQQVVERGVHHLLDRVAQRVLTCGELHGPPDVVGGVGGQVSHDPCVNVPAPTNVGLGTTGGESGYATSVVTLAIAAAAGADPGRTVPVFPLADPNRIGQTNAFFVEGRTLAELLQRISNTVVHGQSDGASVRGGFDYTLDGFRSDGSAMGWGVLALLDAMASGATVPNFAKTELEFSLDNPAAGGNHQINANGSMDYQVNTATINNGNVAKAGIALQALHLIGRPVGDPDVQAVIRYIGRNWGNTGNVQNPNNFGNPVDTQDFRCDFSTLFNKGCGYAMFNVFKGLRLYGVNILEVGPDGNTTPLDWYRDYVDYLVSNQSNPASTTGGQWARNSTAGTQPTLSWSCCETDTDGITALAELILAPVALVLPSNLALTPATASNPVGTNHTVTATATAVGGAPVPGATVNFNVIAGPNAGKAGQAVTDAQGKASFTYHDDAGVVGTDQIRANIGNLQSNVVVKNWVLGPPDIVVSTGNLSSAAGVMTVEVKLRNNGGQEAKMLRITVVNRITAPATYQGPALPINVGDLAAGATVSQDIQFNLNGKASGTVLRFTIQGTYKDAAGKNYRFSSNRLVRVP